MNARRCLFVLALAIACPAQAASGPGDNALLEEILIHGKRTSLAEMRREMIRLEDEFYERYNELNPDDLFDIHCAEEARTGTRTGTRIKRRYCRAGFETRALEAAGRAHLRALQHQSQGLMNMMGSSPGPTGTVSMSVGGDAATAGAMEWIAPDPGTFGIAQYRQTLRETMLELTTKHPELLELLRQRKLLAEEFEVQRRKRFGLAPLPQE